jgi:hypothetical protein
MAGLEALPPVALAAAPGAATVTDVSALGAPAVGAPAAGVPAVGVPAVGAPAVGGDEAAPTRVTGGCESTSGAMVRA